MISFHKKETALSLIGDADAAILRATTVFDKEVISKGKRLKAIVRTGVGVGRSSVYRIAVLQLLEYMAFREKNYRNR